jgi:hypothetical protein
MRLTIKAERAITANPIAAFFIIPVPFFTLPSSPAAVVIRNPAYRHNTKAIKPRILNAQLIAFLIT